MTENELFILAALVAIVVIQVIFAVVLLRILQQVKQLSSMLTRTDGRTIQRQPSMSPVQKPITTPQTAAALIPQQAELVDGKTGIADSIKALCVKYDLVSLTLASKDGLVITSSFDGAEKEAAEWSYRYFSGQRSDEPGILLVGVDHNGNELVGVLRRDNGIPGKWEQPIRNDIITILERWL